MKIEGPNQSKPADKAKKKEGATGGAGQAFESFLAGSSSESSSAGATQSIARMDSLLSVQEADDPAARAAKKRMRERSDNILKELEKIKMALLTGRLTLGHVIDMADVVASHREKIIDPRMTAILDEIDLRAQIEIAKMRMALDKQVSS